MRGELSFERPADPRKAMATFDAEQVRLSGVIGRAVLRARITEGPPMWHAARSCVFEALTAHRPYRAGMAIEKALAIVHGDTGTAFCPVAVSGLDAWLERRGDDWALAA